MKPKQYGTRNFVREMRKLIKVSLSVATPRKRPYSPEYRYIYYWWVQTCMGDAHVHTTASRKRHSASRLQAYHKENGWPVSRMKVVRVKLPPKKRGMK